MILLFLEVHEFPEVFCSLEEFDSEEEAQEKLEVKMTECKENLLSWKIYEATLLDSSEN